MSVSFVRIYIHTIKKRAENTGKRERERDAWQSRAAREAALLAAASSFS